MATISAALVKELRDKTGAGMMDCKTALTETGGDMEAAVDWLRAKGLAKAAKKAGRVAAEGLIGVSEGDGRAAVVEVNSETDFVARNETFQDMVSTIADVARDTGGDTAALAAAPFPGAGKSVEEHVTEMVATIGENLSLRRSAVLTVGEGIVASYIHGAVKAGLGRIGVLVALESSGDRAALMELGKQIAMHVAATSPLSVSVGDLDPAVVDRERQVLTEQARESGKPDNVIEKMIEGRLRKYYEEVVLLSQSFVVNPDLTVEKAVKEAEAAAGAPITVTAFERFAIGEGIEKDETDFAAEVAAAAKS